VAVTLAQLAQAARETSNTENNTGFISATELDRVVNEGVSRVYDVLIESFQQYFALSASFTLTATVNSAALSTVVPPTPGPRFYKELGLDFQIDSQRRETVTRLDSFMDRNRSDRRRYFVSGDLLTVYPPERAAGTYTLWYAPAAPVLTALIDLPVEMERWREMIEVAAAIKVLTKREMQTEGLERQFQALKKGVEDSAASRMAEPAQVPMHGPSWGGYWNQWPGFLGPGIY
jgi:hypothetical protein